MSRRRLWTRMLASTALAGGPALADDAGLFVTSSAAVDAPVARIDEAPVVYAAPSRTPRTTLLSALDDAAAQTTQDSLFDEVERASEDITPPAAPDPAASAAEKPTEPVSTLSEEEVLFEADEVWRETDESPIIAEGNVRAYFGARYLHADRLSYDPLADIVVAEGNVSITDEDLNTAFAGRVELTGDLRDGIAENFSALLEQNARLAGDTAIQEQGARTYLTNAVYTACNVCKKNGEGKTPTWRLRALRVTRDLERKVVRFRHAFFELKGVPVFYVPFLQAADPTVERQSGFLAPTIGASSRLGFNFELPYYFAISNHQDATFYPKYTSNDGVLWQAEYRRQDVSGEHAVQAGIINFDNSDPALSEVPGTRWHIFARGRRKIGDYWKLQYDAERVSDNPYLRRYAVERTGDLRQEISTARANLLRSNFTIAYDDGNTEFSANALLFQDLRTITVCDYGADGRIPVLAANCRPVRVSLDPTATPGPENKELTPLVAPELRFRQTFDEEYFGGRAEINANFAYLQRSFGVDTQRLSASALWERELITPGGHRFNAFADLRGDVFRYQDLDEGTEIRRGDPTRTTDVVGRFAPTAGLEWSYPLAKESNGARFYLEPRVQLLASPANRNPRDIINQDSLSVEHDYFGLFDYNKSTGIDAFEDGQRINAGVNAEAEFDNGISLSGSVGAQLRAQETDAFFGDVGLGDNRSDIVAALGLRFKNNIILQSQFRIDDDTGEVRRAEALAYLSAWRFSGIVSYVNLNENTLIGDGTSEQLSGNLRVRLTNNWYAGLGWREDLDAEIIDAAGNRRSGTTTILQDFALTYRDECSMIELIYRNDRTRDVGLETDNAFLVRFTLTSLVD